MRALCVLAALLPLAACLQPPAIAPLGAAEAQALRAGGGGAAAVVMIVPARGAPLPLAGEVPFTVDGQPHPALRTQEAAVIPAAGRALRIAAGRPPQEIVVDPGRTAFIAVTPEPARPDGRVPVAAIAAIDDAAARPLLAARALVRAAPAAAPEPPSAALRAQPDAATQAAVAEGRIAPGRGRLLVGAGRLVDERGGDLAFLPSLDAIQGDLVIEGVALAALRPNEVVAVDLPPGTYAMHWIMRNRLHDLRWPAAYAAPVPLAVTIRAGQVTAVSADLVDRSATRLGTPLPMTTASGLRYPVLRLAAVPPVGTLVVPPAVTLAAVPGAALPGR